LINLRNFEAYQKLNILRQFLSNNEHFLAFSLEIGQPNKIIKNSKEVWITHFFCLLVDKKRTWKSRRKKRKISIQERLFLNFSPR